MEKLLFTAYTLDVGGVEIALVNLLNNLIKKYDITLVLEKKQGVFLNELNSKIKIIEYKPNQNKNILIRKIINLLKRIKFIIKYKNKYDFAGSFATDVKMGSFCARTASKNNALWVHTDYLEFYENNEKKMRDFFQFINYDKFKNIICVSNIAKKSLEKVLTNYNKNIYFINNLVDYKKIIKKSNEEIELEKDEEKTTFLNVSRQEEKSKKITRIIEVAEKLKQDDFKFRILLIGEGIDTNLYKKLVKEKKLEKYILFLGQKENPYPYFKISDCFLLTSEFEGYPVVFNEAKVLNLPIITTDVSDAEKDIKGQYGIVTEKNINSIYSAMKNFINNKYKIENKFDAQEFNNKILNKLENIFK
ncbi:MAG: glycosyltransferase [Clostridia bacterium]|nr:glycosyltransferase [Clostridia bacterium]